jgi:hypothetical protein
VSEADAGPSATHRWHWPAAIIAIALVLYWPALDARFLADDLFQISMVDGIFPYHPPFSLYFFALDDPANTFAHMERGTLPWWTVPHFRFAHLRPLSSLLLDFDYRVLPRNSPWHHVHSLLWLVATLVAYQVWLRRIVPVPIAVIALLTIAWDEPLAWTVTWLANRCAMVSTTFVAFAMAIHLRRREAGTGDAWHGRDARLELILWGLAFAAGEYAASGLGYLAAYELMAARGTWRVRARSLLPALLVLAVFAATYLWLGCGVYGAESYVDPFTDFDVFSRELANRMARMIGEAWLGIPGATPHMMLRYEDTGLLGDLFSVRDFDMATAARTHAKIVSLAALAILPGTWWLARRWWTDRERRSIAWMSVGAIVALVPLAAVGPATRTLVVPMVGVGVFVGGVTVAAWRAWRAPAGKALDWAGRLLLPIVASLLWWQQTIVDVKEIRHQLADLNEMQAAYSRFQDNPAMDALDLEGKHVVVIATPGLVTGIHGLSTVNMLGRPMPKSWHVLTMGGRPVLARRHGDRTLEVASVGKAMHNENQEMLFRKPSEGLHVGDEVRLTLFTAEIVHERGGSPDSILFHFRWSLDDPRLVFLAPGPDGLAPLAKLAPGEATAIKPPIIPKRPL